MQDCLLIFGDFFLSSDGDEKRIAYETATDAPGDYNEYEYGEDEYEEAMTGPGEDYGQVGSLTHFFIQIHLFWRPFTNSKFRCHFPMEKTMISLRIF